MRIWTVILGPILGCVSGLTAFGQNATYNPPATDVGRLQTPGVVGRSDPLQSFGRVGGSTTGRFDPYSNMPRIGGNTAGAANRGFSPMGRPRGLFDPTTGIPGYRGASGRIPSSLEFRSRGTNPRSTYENNRNQSYATRHQLARGSIGAAEIRDTGVLADFRAVLASRNQFMTPIERLHARANLLSPKSALGQIVTSSDMAIYDARPLKPSQAIAPPPDPIMVTPEEEGAALRAFDNAMAERLNKKYEEYKAEGLKFFKEKNYIRARDCFDICRSLDRKNPWPYAIDTLVAMETQEFSRAVNSLMGAVTRAKSIDELRLNIKELYGTEQEFEKSVNAASNLASADADGKFQAGHLLQSYCAWLNNDIATAVSAAQTTAKSAAGPAEEGLRRFADQLKNEASPAESPM